MKTYVIGTGTMGAGVVQAFAQAGMPVVMKSRTQASLDKAMAKINKGLARLVEKGNTVIVIEHNLDVIRSADWLIDLGPDGGRGGGQLLFAGTPEALKQAGIGATARFL